MEVEFESGNNRGLSPEINEASTTERTDASLTELAGDDPITMMLLTGEARTVHEAETKYLNENVDFISEKVLELVASNLSEEELSRHPLILLLRGHGSRRWEDSLL